MDQIVKNIKDYLEYLQEATQLLVSVHFSEEAYEFFDERFVEVITPYNLHKNIYCSAIKKSRESYEKCIFNQKKIISLLEEQDVIDRICFAGVREIAFPIKSDGRVVGFVTASGYAGKKDECLLPELMEVALIKGDIPRRLIDSVLPPLCRMIELFMLKNAGKEPSEMSKILKYVSDNLSNATLDAVAKSFGRSTSYISHIFKQKTGRSLPAYCNDLRLAEAQKLLNTTDLNITEIGMECGFDDTAYFIRLFRERYGLTPYKYRKRQL